MLRLFAQRLGVVLVEDDVVVVVVLVDEVDVDDVDDDEVDVVDVDVDVDVLVDVDVVLVVVSQPLHVLAQSLAIEPDNEHSPAADSRSHLSRGNELTLCAHLCNVEVEVVVVAVVEVEVDVVVLKKRYKQHVRSQPLLGVNSHRPLAATCWQTGPVRKSVLN